MTSSGTPASLHVPCFQRHLNHKTIIRCVASLGIYAALHGPHPLNVLELDQDVANIMS